MATVHLYVRSQVTTTDKGAKKLEHQMTQLQTAVTEAGGDWHGKASVVVDDEEAPVVVPEPDPDPEPTPEPDPEPEAARRRRR